MSDTTRDGDEPVAPLTPAEPVDAPAPAAAEPPAAPAYEPPPAPAAPAYEAPAAPASPAYEQPSAPPAPAYEVPAAPPYDAAAPSFPPAAYGAAPAYGTPPAPAYGTPPAPAYGTPPAPAYGAPPAPAYGAAPAYGTPPAPAYGAYAPVQPKTNVLAIVSLIAAIVGIFVIPFIGSVVAVITGHMSLSQIKRTGERGHGMGLAGTIVGWVGIGLSIIGLIIVIAWVSWFAANAPYMRMGVYQ